MDQSRLTGLIQEEAGYIEGHSDFSSSEAGDSIKRSYQHYLDLGEGEEQAWDHALELVALAVESARRSGWGLLGTVDHLLFSEHHRVQSASRY